MYRVQNISPQPTSSMGQTHHVLCSVTNYAREPHGSKNSGNF